MNRHAAGVLGFARLLEHLAQEARTPQGNDACQAIRDADTLLKAEELLQELSDFEALVDELGYPPLDGVGRIEPFLDSARTPGACLPVEALLLVRETVSATSALIEYLEDAAREGSPIGRMVEGHAPLYELLSIFSKTFGARGEILDSASPRLAEIRDEQKRLRSKVLKTLQGILKAQDYEHTVQDDFITERSNRFVIPLKTDFRGYLKGIVHDHSRTGQTAFVEPLEVVEVNNRYNEAKEEEEEEIRRILAALTAKVGEKSLILLTQIALAAMVDRLSAKLRLSKKLDAARPVLDERPVLLVGGARHPLLVLRQGQSVVPIDVRLNEDERLVLITGANAGGKTVALKTAGLLTLMAKAGLFIPADPGSVVGWFPEVLADIGDEQDIDRGLSTFSAHMDRLREIFDGLCDGALVLLDEMGTGTDPGQGAALSVAVFEELANEKARVIATTHLDGLKVFVYSVPWGINAAVAFDPATGKPLYRLSYGHAGSSNALEVAKRMGVPQRVLDRALTISGQGGDSVGKLLNDLEAALETARKKEEEADRRKRQLEGELKKQEELLAEARAERRGAREEARKEAREMIRKMREELKAAIEGLASGEKERRDVQSLMEKTTGEVERRFPRPVQEFGKPLLADAVKQGLKVFVSTLGKQGVVDASPSSGKVRVKVGGMITTVPLAELYASADSARAASTAPAAEAKKITAGRVSVVAEKRSPDVVLIGMTVEEALAELDKAVNRALLTGIDKFKVVHGRGSGALRRAVRQRVAEEAGRLAVIPEDSDDAVTWLEVL